MIDADLPSTIRFRVTRSVPAVEHVIGQLRDMILSGRIVPGVHLRQEDLAAQLGVSRAPIREALQALSVEGLLIHNPNQGYFLASLGAPELHQLYLMRRLLETHLLETLRWPDDLELGELTAINERINTASGLAARRELIVANREFHFRILSLADAPLVLHEVRRLWDLSDAYRSLYLFAGESRARVYHEHEQLIQALREEKTARCIEIMDMHRSTAEKHVADILGDSDRPALTRWRSSGSETA
jgi:DNA-binding GntR family transcriptional regulator